MKGLKFVTLFSFISLFTVLGCQNRDAKNSIPLGSVRYEKLVNTMPWLWGDYMQWSYATYDTYVHHKDAFNSNYNRLQQNLKQIADTFKSYYGPAIGDSLTGLLTKNVQLALPVLDAEQSKDLSAVKQAEDKWYANAMAIGDFLAYINPDNWPKPKMERMWKIHITQTIAYSDDLINDNYHEAIKDFDRAKGNMMGELSSVLVRGMGNQFPGKF